MRGFTPPPIAIIQLDSNTHPNTDKDISVTFPDSLYYDSNLSTFTAFPTKQKQDDEDESTSQHIQFNDDNEYILYAFLSSPPASASPMNSKYVAHFRTPSTDSDLWATSDTLTHSGTHPDFTHASLLFYMRKTWLGTNFQTHIIPLLLAIKQAFPATSESLTSTSIASQPVHFSPAPGPLIQCPPLFTFPLEYTRGIPDDPLYTSFIASVTQCLLHTLPLAQSLHKQTCTFHSYFLKLLFERYYTGSNMNEQIFYLASLFPNGPSTPTPTSDFLHTLVCSSPRFSHE